MDNAKAPTQEYRLSLGDREWSVRHSGMLLTYAEEASFFRQETRLPYGVLLWPSAIALAHELHARAEALRGKTVLELGAGTGLPGIVAASLGAAVVQTDHHDQALAVCRENAERNQVTDIELRLEDWTAFTDERRYDYIIGADILYATTCHPALEAIFRERLRRGGRVLLGDPFRRTSVEFLESLEQAGWMVQVMVWDISQEVGKRRLGVFELRPPE